MPRRVTEGTDAGADQNAGQERRTRHDASRLRHLQKRKFDGSSDRTRRNEILRCYKTFRGWTGGFQSADKAMLAILPRITFQIKG